MIEYTAILFVLVPLFIYSVLLSIECGTSVFAFSPHLLGTNLDVSGYINPAWEATNVFLVFTIIAFIAFFPGAISIWGTKLVLPILFFLLVMGARTLGMLLFFYAKEKSVFVKYLLLVPSMLAPGVFVGGILPFFITGSTALTKEGAAMGILAIIAMLTISFLFFSYVHFRTKQALFSFTGAVIIFGIAFFAAAFKVLPYIIYPNMTVFNSLTDISSARTLIWVFSIGSIIIIPALWLMYDIALTNPHKKHIKMN